MHRNQMPVERTHIFIEFVPGIADVYHVICAQDLQFREIECGHNSAVFLSLMEFWGNYTHTLHTNVLTLALYEP